MGRTPYLRVGGSLRADEPTSSLDLGNQALVLRQIRNLAAAGLAVVMISHTPDHAFAVGTQAGDPGQHRDILRRPAVKITVW